MSAAQLSACLELTDSAPCVYADVVRASCAQGVCLPAACGNGRLDPGEACDDGNQQSGDGCREDCGSDETCGNGAVDEPGEQCDCGADVDRRPTDCPLENGAPGALCSDDCRLEYCGNGVLDPGEVCDDGNGTVADGCTPDCLSDETCGNSIVDIHVGETCDDGNTEADDGCSATCRLESCGNGVLDPGEVCDDGNGAAGDACAPNCLSDETCGNGVRDLAVGEQCDCGTDPTALPLFCAAPNGAALGHCSATCQRYRCGNGVVDPPETCDDGGLELGDGCTPDCLSDETCGNGRLDDAVGESCDCGTDQAALPTGCLAPNGEPNSPCSATCTARFCGNGEVEPWEDCDDGNTRSGDGCRADCFSDETCGNGHTDLMAGETCDCGTDPSRLPLGCPAINGAPGSPCGNTCHHRFCGDSTVDPGEVCDDGNTQSGDGCSDDCLSDESCGNGQQDLAARETCDDGNVLSGDGCSALCQLERCGNGQQEGPEGCDDGNTQSGDGCSALCTVEVCGNGVIDAGETCDHGPANGQSPDPCTATCHLTLCGDGYIGGAEVCDGSHLGSATCSALGYNAGVPTCRPDCLAVTDASCFDYGDGRCDLANGETYDASAPADCGFVGLATGNNHACAVRADGSAACWGRNAFGQLGNGGSGNRDVPTAVLLPPTQHLGSPAPQVAAGGSFTCQLRQALAGSELWCWGGNTNGQLANGSNVNSSVPVRSAVALGDMDWVALGRSHGCVIPHSTGTPAWLHCWGKNQVGQVGIGSMGADILTPTPIDHGPGVSRVALGEDFSCAQLTGDDLYCWGEGGGGRLGLGDTQDQPSPVYVTDGVEGLLTSRDGLGDNFTITAHGLWRWGNNAFGQVDGSLSSPQTSLVSVPTGVYDVLEMGDAHVCGVRSDQVYCWGDNDQGQLGNGTYDATSIPQPVLSLLPGESVQLSLGTKLSCVLRQDGRVQCWGNSVYGEVGSGYSGGSVPQPSWVVMP